MKNFSILLSLLVSASTFAQDYWAKMPAFPTGCYTDNDPLRQQIDALRDELTKKIEEETNKTKAHFEKMTDAEKMEMVKKQMNMTPQEIRDMQNNAMKTMEIMQKAQEAGTAVTNRYNDLEAEYNSERGRDLSPLMEEARKLPDGEGTPDWAIKKGEELAKQYDQKYQALCAKYFTGPDALFKKWLADYKQYIVDYTIPMNKANYAAQMQQYGILNATTPSAEWEGVKEYLDYYRSSYGLREPYPQRGE